MNTLNMKRFIMAVVAVAVFVMAYGWIYHGMLLAPIYDATQQLWRTDEEMKNYCTYAIASQILFAFIATYIFTRHYEGKGTGEGFRFGMYIGLLLAALDLYKYSYMPVPLDLVLAWMLGSVIMGLGTGIVASLVYRR